jgi:hypothetical protein
MIARISQAVFSRWTHLIDLPLDDETTPPAILLAQIISSLHGPDMELVNPEALCGVVAYTSNGPIRVQLMTFNPATNCYTEYESLEGTNDGEVIPK